VACARPVALARVGVACPSAGWVRPIRPDRVVAGAKAAHLRYRVVAMRQRPGRHPWQASSLGHVMTGAAQHADRLVEPTRGNKNQIAVEA